MKATAHYAETMAKAIAKYDTPERRARYFRELANDPIVDMDSRYRWDLLWLAIDMGDYDYDTLRSETLNDAHLDTMLKRIVPPVQAP